MVRDFCLSPLFEEFSLVDGRYFGIAIIADADPDLVGLESIVRAIEQMDDDRNTYAVHYFGMYNMSLSSTSMMIQEELTKGSSRRVVESITQLSESRL